MSIDLDSLAVETLAEKARTNFVSVKGVFLPVDYERIADAIQNFQVRDDDIWVCSFPKTGTTWVQEMVWGLTHVDDFENSKEEICIRCPFLEFSGTTSFAKVAMREHSSSTPSWAAESVEFCKNLSSPRQIKTHLPFQLLPRQIRNGERKPKIVYVTRDARDTCISYYHFLRMFEGHRGTFEQFCQLFLGDRVIYGPFWDHVQGFWEKKNMKHLLLIKFEDMREDLQSVIRKTASFLGRQFNDSKVQSLANHLSFAQMKVNPSLNRNTYLKFIKSSKLFGDSEGDGEFLRDGRSGQWESVMSSEMKEKFDERTKKMLKNRHDLEGFLSN